MATTKNRILHDKFSGGVNIFYPTHMLPQDSVLQLQNMRLTPIPSGIATTASTPLFFCSPPAKAAAIVPESGHRVFMKDGEIYNDASEKVYYTQKLTGTIDSTPVGKTVQVVSKGGVVTFDGTKVVNVVGSPSGEIICFWFGHTFIGRADGVVNLLRWSRNDNWVISPTNSAGYFKFDEWASQDVDAKGITGLYKFGSLLWVFMPTAIIPIRWVGAPTYINIVDDAIIYGTGSAFVKTSVFYHGKVYFYDCYNQSFFTFDGSRVTEIGQPIRRYLLCKGTKPFSCVAKDDEVIWSFDNIAFIYNERFNAWSTATINSAITGVDVGGKSSLTLNKLVDYIEDVHYSFEYYKTNGKTYTKRLIAANGTASADIPLLTNPPPTYIIETGDYHYGTLSTVKECDEITVNATGSVDVWICGRMDFNKPLRYVKRGTVTAFGQILHFKPVVGKIFRYKLCSSTAFNLYGFEVGLSIANTERYVHSTQETDGVDFLETGDTYVTQTAEWFA